MPHVTAPSVTDLAIFGGTPAFADKLHVGRPNIGDRDQLLERIGDILDRRWLTNNGHYVQEFERTIAKMVGAKHCIATCNGEIALEIAIRALELKGEVIVPSFTFVATAHALQWQEITPVFADIDPRTHLIDPESVLKLITPRTSGIIGVHLWGQPCDVEALQAIADEHNLKLMFDAAHAFGCGTSTRLAGTWGEAEVFSFHATKLVNSLEGGAIVTNDDALARKIRLMKNFGFLGFDNVGYVGTNGKMNEFSDAMGLTSIESMDAFVAHNRVNYDCYREQLSTIPGVTLLEYDEDLRNNYQYVIAEVDEEESTISRDWLLDVLWAENILARRYFYPGCHRMQPYRAYFPNAGLLLPETERVSSRVLVLPTGQTMMPDDVDRVCAVIRTAVEHGSEVTFKLKRAGKRLHGDVFGR
jgi:dTDP-4-amino-4,6-dideoxygalactose transaminase